jgi:hypothetical protein
VNLRHMDRPDKQTAMDDTEIDEALSVMEQDPALKTPVSLMKDEEQSVRLVSFREKHAAHLKKYPKLNPRDYLSNLRTMIKIRP